MIIKTANDARNTIEIRGDEHGKLLFNLSPSTNAVSCKKTHYLKDST